MREIIPFVIEAISETLDDNIGSAQSENALFACSVLGIEILDTAVDNCGKVDIDPNWTVILHSFSQRNPKYGPGRDTVDRWLLGQTGGWI